jgi:EcoRII C terminal
MQGPLAASAGEAARIEKKYLLTLEAGISEGQTSQMQVRDFLGVVRERPASFDIDPGNKYVGRFQG